MTSPDPIDFIAQTFGFTRVDAFQLETTQPINVLAHALYLDPRYLPVAQLRAASARQTVFPPLLIQMVGIG